MLIKSERRLKLRKKIRSRISGTAERPRLSVFRSNSQIYAQLIDDVVGKTLVAASSRSISEKATKVDIAKIVGKNLAEKALAAGINTCVFDRGGYLYHGRVKSLADGAREGGLNF
ncbi:MAG: 50S ribosomal protein L18 [Bacteroidia bacterium]